jgi:anti-anti-sigma factor
VAASRLQLLSRERDQQLEIELHGELDLATGSRLMAAVDAALANPRIHAVRLRTGQLRFVDMRGLSTLLHARELAASTGCDLTIGDCPVHLRRVSRLAGMDSLLGLSTGPVQSGGSADAQATAPARTKRKGT